MDENKCKKYIMSFGANAKQAGDTFEAMKEFKRRYI